MDLETGASFVPCGCSTCNGTLVNSRTRRAHEARDLRMQSTRPLSYLNDRQTVTFATPNAPDRRNTQKRASFLPHPQIRRNITLPATVPVPVTSHPTPMHHHAMSRTVPSSLASSQSRPDIHESDASALLVHDPAFPTEFDGSEPPSPHHDETFLSESRSSAPLFPDSGSPHYHIPEMLPSAPQPMITEPIPPVVSRPRPPVQMVSFRSTTSTIVAEEQRGLQHIRRIHGSGETFLPIADDDWEEEEDDAAVEESGPTDDCQVQVPAENEETHDPFRYAPSPVHPHPTSAEIHPNRAVLIIYLLVLWLHTQFHLAFRACAALLVVLSLAFKAAGTSIEPNIFTTLPPVINALNAEASMQVYPVCPTCLKVFPSTVPRDSSCDRCTHRLFEIKKKTPKKPQQAETQQDSRPRLQFPSKSIEDYLTTMLAVPGVEDEMDAWRRKCRVQGKYTDIFDGDVCRTIEGDDGSPFFHPGEGVLEPDELRLGVSLGADW